MAVWRLLLLLPSVSSLWLEAGADVPQGALAAVKEHLAPWLGNADNLTISIGSTPSCPPNASLAVDAFEVAVDDNGVVCARGGSLIGAAYAAFAVLQRLGFAFLHPLRPTVPSGRLDLSGLSPGTHDLEVPAFAWRGFHLHTQHPLELGEVLQGADALIGAAGNTTIAWEHMVPEVARLCQWLVANRQNRLDWLLLTTPLTQAGGQEDMSVQQTPFQYSVVWCSVILMNF